MARKAKPWFWRQSGWWMAYVSGRKWVSDWTKNAAIRNVLVAFTWAAGEERLIGENPFRGVTHPTGEPRPQ
jgi:hypothetical protein